MSVDILHEKIRKSKNPSVLDLSILLSDLPPHLLAEDGNPYAALRRFYRELLGHLKGVIPAVRLSFASYAFLGAEGLELLSDTLRLSCQEGYYVLLDAPELLSVRSAEIAAEVFFGEEALYPCDGLVIASYYGSDILKPFLPWCRNANKDIFWVVRTANKSGSELQDLLSGTRLVHSAAADIANRYGTDMVGKSGYSRISIMAAASSGESLRSLRTKYPKLFLVLDGFDYPNSNAKNCSYAFDRLGHGAVACAGSSITCAWKQTEFDGTDYLAAALAAAERMKKNLNRYISVL